MSSRNIGLQLFFFAFCLFVCLFACLFDFPWHLFFCWLESLRGQAAPVDVVNNKARPCGSKFHISSLVRCAARRKQTVNLVAINLVLFLLMEEIPNNHRLDVIIKPCKWWDKQSIYWLAGFLNHQQYEWRYSTSLIFGTKTWAVLR